MFRLLLVFFLAYVFFVSFLLLPLHFLLGVAVYVFFVFFLLLPLHFLLGVAVVVKLVETIEQRGFLFSSDSLSSYVKINDGSSLLVFT